MGPEDERLDSCIKCTICVANCPVVKVTDQYAGPKQNGPDLERFRLEDETVVHPSVGYCTNCKKCNVACPSGVNIADMIMQAKGRLVRRQGAPVRDWILSHAELVGKAAMLAPSVVNSVCRNEAFRRVGEKLLGIDRNMPFPVYAKQSFYSWSKGRKEQPGKRKILYFPGCYTSYNTPQVGKAVVEVLEHNGVAVAIEEFKCCGLPLVANGLIDEAKEYARQNQRIIDKYVKQGYEIITNCPSCNLALRTDYVELFELENAQEVSLHVYDIFEYLQILANRGQLQEDFQEIQEIIGYHQPCHLSVQGCGISSLDILARIPGLQVQNLDAGCCGQAGSYGFKVEKYPVSMAIGQEVVVAVEETGVRKITTECGMCQLRIGYLTGREVLHPIELVHKAYQN